MTYAPAIREQLNSISNILLDDALDYASLSRATEDYFRLLTDVVVPDGNFQQKRDPLELPTGKSIGPYWAAMCILDLCRTRQFVRGLYRALLSAQDRFPHTPVHVLYAGTGPFAALALPVITRFTPDQVQFTLMEVHPSSYEWLKHTIDSFQIQPYVRQCLHADAADFHTNDVFHILLTETMQRALDKEPQVDITRHLVKYLHPDGYLLPQSIRIDTGMIHPGNEEKRMQDLFHLPEDYIHPIQTIFELNRHTALSPALLEEVVISIPASSWVSHPALCLFTTVQVFDTVCIHPWQSGVTLPKTIRISETGTTSPSRVWFQYQTGSDPGFTYHFGKN